MALHLIGHKKESLDHALTKYLRPKFVYIPLINGGDTNITLLAQKGEYVKKGTVIARRKNPFKIPIVSSVSGVVVGFEEHLCYNGSLVKCVKIENDMKETSINEATNKKMSDYTKKEFIELIKEAGIVGMGGSGFPTYAKYETKNKLKTLIVNATESEPYVTCDQKLFETYIDEILETIDAIVSINEMENAYIVVKKNNSDLISKLTEHLGTFLKIKLYLMEDDFSSGWERKIVNNITNEDYDNYPLELGVVVNNVSTIYAIYKALKYNECLTERTITFAGDMLKVPQNIIVKIGTPVKEVIDAIEGYKRNKDINFIAGGPLMGNSLPNDDLVITPNLDCVLVLKKKDDGKVTSCINCGKCVQVCPAKISPVLIKNNLLKPNKLKQLKPSKCIECGMCSFICPANLNLRECVKLAKNKEVRK